MSKWDEKAYEHAEGRSGEYFGALPEQLFEWGARWQREALLADDVIERAARAIDPDVFFMSKTEWEAQNDHVEGDYENARLEALGTARAALTAALREDKE